MIPITFSITYSYNPLRAGFSRVRFSVLSSLGLISWSVPQGADFLLWTDKTLGLWKGCLLVVLRAGASLIVKMSLLFCFKLVKMKGDHGSEKVQLSLPHCLYTLFCSHGQSTGQLRPAEHATWWGAGCLHISLAASSGSVSLLLSRLHQIWKV